MFCIPWSLPLPRKGHTLHGDLESDRGGSYWSTIAKLVMECYVYDNISNQSVQKYSNQYLDSYIIYILNWNIYIYMY